MHLAMLSTAGLMCEADREDAWYHPPDIVFTLQFLAFPGLVASWRGTPSIRPCRLDDRLPAVDTPARRRQTLPIEAENSNALCLKWLGETDAQARDGAFVPDPAPPARQGGECDLTSHLRGGAHGRPATNDPHRRR